MKHLRSYKDDFILLVEAGFIAVNQADEEAATKLFNAAQLLDSNNQLPEIGVGYLHMHKLQLKEACKAFEHVLDKEPNNEMAKAFLGICLGLQPTQIAKGEKILEQTNSHSKDPMVKKLCDTALHFVDKFVKKSAGPAESHKKK